MKKVSFLTALIGIAGTLYAQEGPRLALSGGAGFTRPVGRTGTNLDTGWNIRGGAGLNFTSHFGVMLEGGYDSMGIKTGVLNNLGFGGGNLDVFSVTLNPVIHLLPRGPVDFYITGGGGYYRQNQSFTQPSVDVVTGYNPWFGFYPVTVPVNVVVSSYSVNKPGINAGAGIAFGSKWGGKFFAEARYNRIFTGNFHTDYIPVTIGFRR